MIKIEIENLDKVVDKFGRMAKKTRRNLQEALVKSAFEVEIKSKAIVPFDTGHLMRSIRKNIMPLSAWIAPHTEYAIYIHEGTKRYPLHLAPKKPGRVRQFMKVGAEKALPRIQKNMDEAIKKSLK